MWCVVADNGDEFWVYGMFNSETEARNYAEKKQTENPDAWHIEYNAAEFLQTETADGKQEDNPAA